MNIFKTALAAAALLALPLTAANAAMTAEQCTEMWKKADANADGTLAADEATKFSDAMTKANATTATAGTVTQDEFTKACTAGTFDGVQM